MCADINFNLRRFTEQISWLREFTKTARQKAAAAAAATKAVHAANWPNEMNERKRSIKSKREKDKR